VYRRADLSRTVTLVVALLLTAISTAAFAREEHTMNPQVPVMSQKAWASLSAEERKLFRGAAMRSSRFMRDKWQDLAERSRKQAEAAGVKIVTNFDRRPFEAAMGGIYAKAQRDPAIARPIERIRKVE
jgi:TRAP-type C4-dicarboxylate transport system substrate-binding protein